MAQVVSERKCACGCGTIVQRTFAPGHDQRLVSHLARDVATGKIKRAEAVRRARQISPALARRVGSAATRRK